MNHMFRWVASASVATASTLVMGSAVVAQDAAIAQEQRPRVDATIFPNVVTTLEEQALDTFYSNDQDYLDNRSIGRQVLWIFGIRYTDHEIVDDGKAIQSFVQEAWDEQNSNTAVIRTMDLPNPFQSSLLLESGIPPEDFPPTTFQQPIAPPPPVASPAPQFFRPEPVPALW